MRDVRTRIEFELLKELHGNIEPFNFYLIYELLIPIDYQKPDLNMVRNKGTSAFDDNRAAFLS